MVKKGHYKNEGLILAWDSIRVFENHVKVYKII